MTRMPTTRLSLDYMRKLGYTAAVVERWVPAGAGGPQVKQDLFGILDLVALGDGETIGVQTTDKTHLAAHARKIDQSAHIEALRRAGWKIVIHGWSQPRGKGTRYEVEEVEV